MKKERERSWERERERERMENERERSNYILAMLMLICSEGHSLPPIFVKTSATKNGKPNFHQSHCTDTFSKDMMIFSLTMKSRKEVK